MAESLGPGRDNLRLLLTNLHCWRLHGMAVNLGTVGRRCLLELDSCGRQKEEVFEIRLFQSHARTSYHRRFASEVYIDWAVIWARFAVVLTLGFSCTVGRCYSCLGGALRGFVVEMLKMIRHVFRGLPDVS
jgi:hypothetical protein